MSQKIERIKRGTPEFEELLREIKLLRWNTFPRDSGRRIAANALKDKDDTEILLVREPLINIPIGVLSFREEDNGRFLKVVNIGVSKTRKGVGKSLIQRVREIAGKGRSVYLASLNEDSDKFYESLGGFELEPIIVKWQKRKIFQFPGT
jgi:hypothetical protein